MRGYVKCRGSGEIAVWPGQVLDRPVPALIGRKIWRRINLFVRFALEDHLILLVKELRYIVTKKHFTVKKI